MGGVKLFADCVRTEHRRERRARLEHLHGGQGARIGEHDPSPVLELENEPGESWKLLLSGTDDPIARHTKMHVQHGAVVEHRELMLSAALDSRNGTADEAPQTRRPEIPADVWVKHLRANDARPGRGASERTGGMLDFRELWHERQRTLATARAQACAIDSPAWTRRV